MNEVGKHLMLCLEVWRERRVEGRREEESSGEESRGDGYPPSFLDVFKIKGERNN